jgi:replicative superfamily II helicase
MIRCTSCNKEFTSAVALSLHVHDGCEPTATELYAIGLAQNQRIEELEAEVERLMGELINILHKTENARMWNGQGRDYQGGLHMKRIHDVAEAAVKAAKEVKR